MVRYLYTLIVIKQWYQNFKLSIMDNIKRSTVEYLRFSILQNYLTAIFEKLSVLDAWLTLFLSCYAIGT